MPEGPCTHTLILLLVTARSIGSIKTPAAKAIRRQGVRQMLAKTDACFSPPANSYIGDCYVTPYCTCDFYRALLTVRGGMESGILTEDDAVQVLLARKFQCQGGGARKRRRRCINDVYFSSQKGLSCLIFSILFVMLH